MASVLLMLSFFANAVFSATIYGDVYGPELEKIPAIIYVNTTPPTRIVVNGSYSLSLDSGTYVIYTYSIDGQYMSRDVVGVSSNSSTEFDIILLPSIEISDVPSIDVGIENGFSFPLAAAVVFAAGFATLIIVFLLKRKTNDLDETASRALSIIEREKRIHQKELRKILGLSEAKVSMVVAELEETGYVKKIRKGRANIIVFKGKPSLLGKLLKWLGK